jgi:hypothetical protein
MSCAAATFHLRASLAARGVATQTTLFPNRAYPTWIARVATLGVGDTDDPLAELGGFIAQRHTNRGPFMGMPVPDEVVATLRAAAEVEGAWLLPFDAEYDRVRIVALVMEGDHQQWSDPRFRAELSQWIRPVGAPSQDGMASHLLGGGALPTAIARWVVRTVDLGTRTAATDRDLAAASPMVAVLGTDGDGPKDWARAGMALDRVLLELTGEGLSASFLNQPVEVPTLRSDLHAILHERGRAGFAQVVLRIGYGPDAAPTPRRDLRDVILEA